MKTEKMSEFTELTREIAGKEYNVSRREEILLVDFRASLQTDISKALLEMRQCAGIIHSAEFTMNAYLHDAYTKAASRYDSLLEEFSKYFPGEIAVRVAVPVQVEGF